MGTRLQLQTKFETMMGNRNVYFQPPEGKKIEYPCIVYKLDEFYIRHADDLKYIKRRRYFVQHITTDPDNMMVETILDMPYCRHTGRTIVDGLYHDNFELYF